MAATSLLETNQVVTLDEMHAPLVAPTLRVRGKQVRTIPCRHAQRKSGALEALQEKRGVLRRRRRPQGSAAIRSLMAPSALRRLFGNRTRCGSGTFLNSSRRPRARRSAGRRPSHLAVVRSLAHRHAGRTGLGGRRSLGLHNLHLRRRDAHSAPETVGQVLVLLLNL